MAADMSENVNSISGPVTQNHKTKHFFKSQSKGMEGLKQKRKEFGFGDFILGLGLAETMPISPLLVGIVPDSGLLPCCLSLSPESRPGTKISKNVNHKPLPEKLVCVLNYEETSLKLPVVKMSKYYLYNGLLIRLPVFLNVLFKQILIFRGAFQC